MAGPVLEGGEVLMEFLMAIAATKVVTGDGGDGNGDNGSGCVVTID